jgi:hypothetical protein
VIDLIVDGSFEDFSPADWDSLNCVLEYETVAPVYDGQFSLGMYPINSSFGPVRQVASVQQVLTSGVAGQVVAPRLWVYRPSDSLGHAQNDLRLRISSAPGGSPDTNVQEFGTFFLPPDTWTQVMADAFPLPCDSPTLQWWLNYSSVANQAKVLHVDLATAVLQEAAMAVMLMELPLRAILATLQASLNTEIGYVNTEANDGISCPSVTTWFCWDREREMPDKAEVSVFEDAGGEIAEWGSLVSNGQRTPIRTSWTIVVRLAYANRSQLSTSAMRVIGMRYAAALVRCIRNAPQLGQTTLPVDAEPSTPIVVLERATGTDPKTFGTVEMRVAVTINESPVGETVLGGGTRPSATLES